MIDTYTIEKDNIIEALEDIDKFRQKMDKFKDKHPNYDYEIDIKEDEKQLNKWIVELKVSKDEDIKVT